MRDERNCPSCATLSGIEQPPGGIVYDDGSWVVFLRRHPLLVPGQAFFVLKRHCEHLGELMPMELQALGPLMQRTQVAMDRTLKPAKVHFGLYAEGVRHIHLHVFPRMPEMPIGNIPVTFLHVWYEQLARLHLKRPFDDATVAAVAERLRTAFTALPTQD